MGAYGSEVSQVRYGNLIASLAGGVPLDPVAKPRTPAIAIDHAEVVPGPSVGELCLVFLEHAKTHYAKSGKPTAEYDCFKSAIRPFRELYGMTMAKVFGPLALKAVRQEKIERGWCRNFSKLLRATQLLEVLARPVNRDQFRERPRHWASGVN